MHLLVAAALHLLVCAPLGLEAEVRELQCIGFRQQAGASILFVETTEPVIYRSSQAASDRIVIFLPNVRIVARNNARDLPTQYFASPVRHVGITPMEGPSPSVRLEVHTRMPVVMRVQAQDTRLQFFFTPATA